MKKQILLLTMFSCFAISNAQESIPIQKNQFNFYRNISEKHIKDDYTIGYERKLNNEVSIGLNLNYSFSDNYSTILEKNKSMGASISFNYDWSKIIGLNTDKFDIYTGANLGVSKVKYNYMSNYYPLNIVQYSSEEFIMGGKLGARYWITKNIGVTVELDNSFFDIYKEKTTKINLGFNFKF